MHLAKLDSKDIKKCSGKQPERKRVLYDDFGQRFMSNKRKRQRTATMQASFVEDRITHATDIVARGSNNRVSPVDANASATVSSDGNPSSRATQIRIYQKTTDKAADEKAQMAVANAVHSLGWPFSCTTHPSFKIMVSAIKDSNVLGETSSI